MIFPDLVHPTLLIPSSPPPLTPWRTEMQVMQDEIQAASVCGGCFGEGMWWHVDSAHMLYVPWEPKTFIFGGYDPYIQGLKPSFFMVLGFKGMEYFTYIYPFLKKSSQIVGTDSILP